MNKYSKRKSTRLKNYDYSSKGLYFVTICSYNRSNIFGEYKYIVGAGLVSARNNINLSTIGKIINDKSLHKIRKYIVNNPTAWDNDKYNPNKKSHNKTIGVTEYQ